MNDLDLENTEYFNLVGVTCERNLNWHEDVAALALPAAKKLGFRF